ncbi:MAG: M48 family metallopeptidase [Saccharofermentans sp.]|nr:M48 family metallopeptidase [Saccharofermentans sp.]
MDKIVRYVDLNGSLVICEFERKRVKNINVHVRRDGTLYCSVPLRSSVARAEAFVTDNAEYLLKGIQRVKAAEVTDGIPKLFVDGESVKSFGRWKTLKVSQGKKAETIETEDEIRLYVKDISDKEKVKRVYNKYRKESLKLLIEGYAAELYPYFASFGVKFPDEIRYGNFRSFWGICYPGISLVKFSLKLHEQSPELIRYVVAHEFAHFVHADHSPAFWEVVTGVIPNARACQRLLRSKD